MGQQSSHSHINTQQQEASIPLWEYNKEKHGWIQKQYDRDYQKNDWDRFRVVTYNIWFSEKYQPLRFNSLCDILCKSDAQIIGLQESLFLSDNNYFNIFTLCLVTQNILQQLLAQPFVQERYYISDIDGRTFSGWYGVVLLIDIRVHVSHLNLINFPQSHMGRRLVLAEIKLNKDETLLIGTVHLESLDNKQQRLCQLNICQNVFNRFPGASSILMGDFNFNAHGPENIDQFKALPRWIDVWANLMGTQNPGYTYDTETNQMTKINNGFSDRSRIDRIILQSQTFIPTQIEILGDTSTGTLDNLSLFPSDHYGLTAVFEKKK